MSAPAAGSTLAVWVQGARPRTLPAAVAPVLVGSGAAHALGGWDPALALLALIVSVSLQVGVNYANDYSDGIRGTDDTGVRVGPVRLVGQGLARPGDVKLAAFLAFGLAGLAGLALTALSQVWLMLPIGLLAILAAWFYTGGPRPYAYLGLGEIFVFVFFGLVAVLGTTWTQVHTADAATIAAACAVGAWACAMLVTNNLRDIPGDTQVGKRTLAVRLGPARTRVLYAAFVLAPFALLAVTFTTAPWTLLALLALPLAGIPLRMVLHGAEGAALLPALAATGRAQLAYAVLLTVGLALA